MTWQRIVIDTYKCSKCHQLVWSCWGGELNNENAWNGQLLHDKRDRCRGGQPVQRRSNVLLPLVEVRTSPRINQRNQT